MRVHPVGLAFAGRPERAFEVGVTCARLTHGHPRAYLPAGIMAAIVAQFLVDAAPKDAIRHAMDLANTQPDSGETLATIKTAMEAVENNIPNLDYIESTEGGWAGDAALAIGLFCFLRHQDHPLEALFSSVNHSGDSDSTGTICGALLGAVFGMEWLPKEWLDVLEHRKELEELSELLFQHHLSGNHK